MTTEGQGRGSWAHRRALVNGVGLHYVEAGAGPPVILLHGFPEFWYAWRHQISALAGAGLRVLAPDLRGYNESDKPPGIQNYRLGPLSEDVAALIRRLGAGPARVVGHDWGGVIAWALAMRHPEMVAKLAVLNAPHPAVFLRELHTPAQLLRSWYVLFFQLPRLPEALLRAGNFAILGHALRRGPVRPGAFTDEDVRLYKEALARPGALTAALNYYRAALRHRGDATRIVCRISAPTLVIWGERDPYLSPRLTRRLGPWIQDLRVERLGSASHWVQNEAPGQVNRLLLNFL